VGIYQQLLLAEETSILTTRLVSKTAQMQEAALDIFNDRIGLAKAFLKGNTSIQSTTKHLATTV